MHKLLTVFLLVCALAATSASAQEIMDGIAAIVNGDVVTISELRELTAAREMSLRQSLRGDELTREVSKIRHAALKDLIDRQLILQEYKKKEFNIPNYVVEDRIQSIILKEFGGDRAAFVKTLQSQGYTMTRFKEMEKNKIIVQAMRQANVKDNFVITPKQVQAFYDKNRAAYSTPEEIKLRMIVLREGSSPSASPLPDLPDSESKKGMAQEIRDKLANGGDFDRMAAMYSEDPSTANMGGDWGWIQKNTLNEQLTKAAFALQEGKISQVIALGGSYYIMMVESRKPARTKPLQEVKAEIEQNLMQQERSKAQDRWLETLRKTAFIRILV